MCSDPVSAAASSSRIELKQFHISGILLIERRAARSNLAALLALALSLLALALSLVPAITSFSRREAPTVSH